MTFSQKSRDLLAEIQVYRNHSSGLELRGSQAIAEKCHPAELYHVVPGRPFVPLPSIAPLQLKREGGKGEGKKRDLISFSADILNEEERALRAPLGHVERSGYNMLCLHRKIGSPSNSRASGTRPRH